MFALINDTGMLVVLLAVVVLFGASHLPKLARNLGEAGREFRKAHEEAEAGRDLLTPSPEADPRIAAVAEPRLTLSRHELDALYRAREARGSTGSPTGA